MLFAYAIHPIICLMSSKISPFNSITRAYCDDIAIATANLPLSIPKLYICFCIAAEAANLHLHPDKTQCLCIFQQGFEQLHQYITDHLPQLLTVKL